jgi:flagellar hook protein FlgE
MIEWRGIEMLRSLYDGISGMRAFQTKLDVVGNNIANVNTTGYKAGRVTFSDLLSQTMAGASAPTSPLGLGGTNPRQVGLGVQVGSIDTLFTQGSAQVTNVPSDVAIQGNGLFVVSPNAGSATPTYFYTRDGSFKIDANGNLVTAAGYAVLDSTGKAITIPAGGTFTAIDQNGYVHYIDATGNPQTMANPIRIAVFPNPAGLTKVGNNMYAASNNSGTVVNTTPGSGNAGTLMPGMLEMSNVDLTNEFAEMIVAQRGFEANSKIITVSDEILQTVVNLKR